MPDELALVRIPEAAPGYRDSLTAMAHFAVSDFGEGVVGVAPSEGAGAVAQHFELHRVCDAQSDLSDPETWSALRANPPRQVREDPAAFRAQMIARGEEIRARVPAVEGEMVAFRLAALGAASAGDLPALLTANLPALFGQFPRGSLWYVTVSDLLLARLAFGRAQFAFQLTPDKPLGEGMEHFRGASELGLGWGVDFIAVTTLPLLALSPAVLGLQISAPPHVLVFCFGDGVDLRRHYPTSMASLYRPNVLQDALGLDRSPSLAALDSGDGEALLDWWVGKLNRLYSHSADPTRFTNQDGYHDGAAQLAWMITVERLLGDALSLLAEPQASDLHRAQTAFDLLDKAESLLNYGFGKSGKGFEGLLRRERAMRRLREAYSSLPGQLGQRLGDEAQRLFDGLYRQVRANTVDFRLRDNGADIATGDAAAVRAIDDETLVATVLRAVRNSSHGLLEILSNRDERLLLAANTRSPSGCWMPFRCRSASATRAFRRGSPRASASKSAGPPPPRSCCGEPTSPCIAPSRPAGTAVSCSQPAGRRANRHPPHSDARADACKCCSAPAPTSSRRWSHVERPSRRGVSPGPRPAPDLKIWIGLLPRGVWIDTPRTPAIDEECDGKLHRSNEETMSRNVSPTRQISPQKAVSSL